MLIARSVNDQAKPQWAAETITVGGSLMSANPSGNFGWRFLALLDTVRATARAGLSAMSVYAQINTRPVEFISDRSGFFAPQLPRKKGDVCHKRATGSCQRASS
jgi:hypothetical protein